MRARESLTDLSTDIAKGLPMRLAASLRPFALLLLPLVLATSALGAEINTSALSANGWYSDDTRADGTGSFPAGTNLVSDTLTDDPEATASGTAVVDGDILAQILFGPAPGVVPGGTHGGALHLFIAPGSGAGKSQVSHRKDDGTGHAPGSVFGPGFLLEYSWMGDGTPSVTPSVKFGIKTSEFGSTGVSSRTGENAWDKVLIYEPGNLNGGLSDGLWHTETVDFTTGKWWFFDRTAGAGTIGTPMTLSDMAGALGAATLVGGGPKTVQDVYNLIIAGGAHITSVQVGIGSGNAGGSVYVNQLETNFYRAGDLTTFGSLPVHNVTQATDHATIGAALAAAAPGDSIDIDPGTYPETLVLSQSVRLHGEPDRSVVLDVSGGATYGIRVSADDITIDGITLQGGPANNNYGIHTDPGSRHLELRNMTVTGCGRTGIDLNTLLPGLGAELNVIDNVSCIGNGTNAGGFGLALPAVVGIRISDLTTSGNPWGAVGIWPYAGNEPDDIAFLAPLSLGEPFGAINVQPDGPAISVSTDDAGHALYDASAQVTVPASYARLVTGLRSDALTNLALVPVADAVPMAQALVAGTPPFTWSEVTIRELDTGLWSVVPTLSIQAAIDAASPGDVVDVAAGTYVEQLEFVKDVTLEGAGAGSTVVESPASLPLSFTTSAANYPVVLIHAGAAPTLRALTVDGAGQGNANSRFIGIGIRNAGALLEDLHVTRVRETPFSGSQHGVAIYAYNDDTVARSISVQDCLIDDFQKNAMALIAADTTPLAVDVSGCTVTGAGATTVTAQNGIQIQGDLVTGLVDGNTVDGIAYDNTAAATKWAASSILAYFTDADITNNVITGAHLGVYQIDGGGDVTGNDLAIEKVGVYAYGIIATDPPAAVPSPVDGGMGSAPAVRGGLGAAAASALLEVEISGNTVAFSGGDNTDTYGIEADAGYGPDDLAVTVLDNDITGFDYGLVLYQCESGCDTGVFTSLTVTDNSFVGNSTAGLYTNVDFLTVDASCNWWGDLNGPDVPPAHPNPSGDAILGDAIYAPWLDGPGGACTEYGSDAVAADVSGVGCIANDTPCVTVPVVFTRSDMTSARGITVTIELSGGLELCTPGTPSASITQGSWLGGFSVFQVTDNGGGSYTVDQAVLGGDSLSCGPTGGGTLFTVDVTGVADGTGVLSVTMADARDCGNPFSILPAIPGAPAELSIDFTPPAGLGDLSAAQQLSGNDGDGNTVVNVSWSVPGEPDAATVEVYRKGFGSYPEYDDLGGSAPTAPADPSSALGDGWTLAASAPAGSGGIADEPGTRDYWYYVAFVTDECGNVGAVSNRTNGTLDYHLGDFSDGVTPGDGDNAVDLSDLSALGAAYGTVDGDIDYRNWADIGPSSNSATSGLPSTDNAIQFEDLILFAINYGEVSKPGVRHAAAAENALAWSVTEAGPDLELAIELSSDGRFQGASLPLRWNPSVVEPAEVRSGVFADLTGAAVLVPEPGTVDLAALGRPFAGSGTVATVRFHRIGDGDPGLGLGEPVARDGANAPLPVTVRLAGDGPDLPVRVGLLPGAPNPFRAGTTLRFTTASPGPVRLRVYGYDGSLVRTLIDDSRPAGDHEIAWDGRDDHGRAVAAGAYLVRFESAGVRETRSLIRLQ